MALEQAQYNVVNNTNLSVLGVDDLTHMISEYPFFAPAQFLLALKQKEKSSYSYHSQIQKAALFFSNPMWLQYQLHNGTIQEPVLEKVDLNNHELTETAIPTTSEKPIVTEIAEPKAAIEATSIVYQSIPTIEAEVTKTVPLISDEVNASTITNVETEVTHIDTIVPEITNLHKDVAAIIPEPEILPVSPMQPTSVITTVQENGVVDYTAYALSNSLRDEPITAPTVPSTNANFENKPAFAIPTLEAVKKMLNVNSIDASTAATIVNQPTKNNASTIPAYTFNGFSDNTISTNAVTLSEAAYHEDDNDTSVLEEEEEKNHTNNIASVLSHQISDFKKPITEDTKLEFETEPLFKVDYFASQGIKIDLTKQPQDKLTIQLRRFTDWLKQIKGQSPNPQDLGTDPELEKAIANIAKASIAAREIVTETMADVFIKQGKVDKAIQLYIKLSFLDPQKSAYFAQKIQQLKGI